MQRHLDPKTGRIEPLACDRGLMRKACICHLRKSHGRTKKGARIAQGETAPGLGDI